MGEVSQSLVLCNTTAERELRKCCARCGQCHTLSRNIECHASFFSSGKNISLTFLKYFSCCLEHREEFCAVHNAKETRLLSIATFNELSSNVIEEFLAESENKAEDCKMKFFLTYAMLRTASLTFSRFFESPRRKQRNMTRRDNLQ